ncbi:asparagine-rich Zinc finger protein azf1 [Plakobranchus ocellatus]|uniref:Asparagine-rich Zinc finger protein azf1 n=1 Tax=Plakobranchus ocellatus TaxID=259542 RepID=A0AAV4CZB4_9GAST|nr:asparagine-rich Zinc finger protein azf1 [Plakobranchus ocellatus]
MEPDNIKNEPEIPGYEDCSSQKTDSLRDWMHRELSRIKNELRSEWYEMIRVTDEAGKEVAVINNQVDIKSEPESSDYQDWPAEKMDSVRDWMHRELSRIKQELQSEWDAFTQVTCTAEVEVDINNSQDVVKSEPEIPGYEEWPAQKMDSLREWMHRELSKIKKELQSDWGEILQVPDQAGNIVDVDSSQASDLGPENPKPCDFIKEEQMKLDGLLSADTGIECQASHCGPEVGHGRFSSQIYSGEEPDQRDSQSEFCASVSPPQSFTQISGDRAPLKPTPVQSSVNTKAQSLPPLVLVLANLSKEGKLHPNPANGPIRETLGVGEPPSKKPRGNDEERVTPPSLVSSQPLLVFSGNPALPSAESGLKTVRLVAFAKVVAGPNGKKLVPSQAFLQPSDLVSKNVIPSSAGSALAAKPESTVISGVDEPATVVERGMHSTASKTPSNIVNKKKNSAKQKVTKPTHAAQTAIVDECTCQYCNKLFPSRALRLKHQKIAMAKKEFRCFLCWEILRAKCAYTLHLAQHYKESSQDTAVSEKDRVRVRSQYYYKDAEVVRDQSPASKVPEAIPGPIPIKNDSMESQQPSLASCEDKLASANDEHGRCSSPEEESWDSIDWQISNMEKSAPPEQSLTSAVGDLLPSLEPIQHPDIPLAEQDLSDLLVGDYYKCPHCRVLFRQKWLLVKHMFSHGRYLRCRKCHKDFPLVKNLITHMKEHKPDLLCEICGCQFETVQKLAEHLFLHNANSSDDIYCYEGKAVMEVVKQLNSVRANQNQSRSIGCQITQMQEKPVQKKSHLWEQKRDRNTWPNHVATNQGKDSTGQVNSEINKSNRPETNHGNNPETNKGNNPGTDKGNNPEPNHDNNFKTNHGNNPETNKGNNPGTDKGNSSEPNHGNNFKTNHGNNPETNKGNNFKTNHGNNPETNKGNNFKTNHGNNPETKRTNKQNSKQSSKSLTHRKFSFTVFSCFYCDKTFRSVEAVKNHYNLKHQIQSRGGRYEDLLPRHALKTCGQKNMFTCLGCALVFPSQSDLNKHSLEWHPIYKCDMCGKKYCELKAAELHMRRHLFPGCVD